MFLEKRFGVQVPNISPWHRAVSGDLTSVFDFASPNDSMLPAFPDMSNHAAIDAAQAQLPSPIAPSQPQPLFQERGIKASRALPYVLAAGATLAPSAVTLAFANAGSQGAVFHVYDQLHLDRIPRRYTVEAGKTLSDVWSSAADGGAYDLWVHGPNGFVRIFQGNSSSWAAGAFRPEITVDYAAAANGLVLVAVNGGTQTNTLAVTPNSAFLGAAVQTLSVPAGGGAQLALGLNASGSWYDFTVAAANFTRRFAGRMETGRHGISDPMMALKL
jgi:phospholipase C